MEEDGAPPPPPNNNSNPANRQGEPNNSANNNEQYSHLRTFYQIQNMLTRQLIQAQSQSQHQQQQQQAQDNTNNDHVSINMAHDSPRNNNAGNNNGTNANAGETIAAQGLDGARVDLQLLGSWLEQSFPFILLLVLLWIYQHRNGIVLYTFIVYLS